MSACLHWMPHTQPALMIIYYMCEGAWELLYTSCTLQIHTNSMFFASCFQNLFFVNFAPTHTSQQHPYVICRGEFAIALAAYMQEKDALWHNFWALCGSRILLCSRHLSLNSGTPSSQSQTHRCRCSKNHDLLRHGHGCFILCDVVGARLLSLLDTIESSIWD